MMLEAGQQLGRYQILSAIGAGGMGEVFLADDSYLNRKVALKVLPEKLAGDSERLRRFEQEAKAASALNHPNILTIFEFGSENSTHFLAAEYVKGVTLRERLKQGDLTLSETLDIATQIASALCAAHEAGIIHRDIKPENVMIREDGYVKVLDFGLAKLVENAPVDEESETRMQVQTQAGMILGTAAYMSPEQAGGKAVDARTDIFSFGCVLYEILTQRQPFTGKTINHTIVAILEKEPPPLSQFDSNYPVEIRQIIDKCLAKKRERRYKSAKDLFDDLKEFKEELNFQSKLKRNSKSGKETEAETQIIKAAATAETGKQTNSIAVLPFANMSADEENEYFCDGLAEELLNALAKIDDLKVAARTSAFSFKGKNTEASQIGKTLNVNTILEGSVRKSGNRVRITVQLVNASDGYHQWSERYDREMQDIFDVQDEITLAVVDALKVKLLGEEKAAVLKRGTDDTEAYELYLRGLFYFNKRTADGIKKAIELFGRAIEKDPNYALAYVGLADCYLLVGVYAGKRASETLPPAKAAATRALEIDDSLAEAHATLGHFYLRSLEWQEAEREIRRSIELNPNYAAAHQWYADYFRSQRRFEEAMNEVKRAQELDPLSPSFGTFVGIAYLNLGNPEAALKEFQRVVEFAPNFPLARLFLAEIYLRNGRNEEAVTEAQKTVELSGRSSVFLGMLGYTYARVGKRAEALAVIEELKEKRAAGEAVGFNFAQVYVGLKDNDQAIAWLERDFEAGDTNLLTNATNSFFYNCLVSDSRYQNLLRRIGIATDENAPRQTTSETSEAQTAMLLPVATKDKEIPTTIPKSNEQSLPDKPKAKPKWWLFGLIAFVLLMSGFFGYLYFSPNKQISSIAVLPFENASGNVDLDYLSDGVSESVIDRLSQLPHLKVIARSSSFRYRGQNLNLREVANVLGVDAIVTGRVVPRGDSYQIRVELVDAREDKQLWGENFTRKASDVQILQTDISREIAENLRFRLTGAQSEQLASQGTTNPQAYELLLKGRFYFNKGGGQSGENFRKAVEYYEQAVTADPNYALAHAELSYAYAIGGGGILDRKQRRIRQEAAARKALELDKNLADAHFAMAQFKRDNGEWVEAEREYKRAIELNPNLAGVYSAYANYLHIMKRQDESVAAIRRSLELDPLSIVINFNAINIYYRARHYDEAVAAARKAFELEPNNSVGHNLLGNVYETKGMYAEALAEYREVQRLRGGTSGEGPNFARVYAKMGERAKAEEILQKFKASENNVEGRDFALLYDALGRRDEAFAELEKDYAENRSNLSGISSNPLYDNLRSDPRFQDLLRRMNLPQ